MIRYTIDSRLDKIKQARIYFPKIVRATTLKMSDVEDLLQRRSTMTEGEVHAFLIALSEAIRFYVTNSYTVEVEGLGIFTPAIKAKAVNVIEDVTAKTILKKSVNYRPSIKLDNKLNDAKFIKAQFRQTV